jgi:predicted aldo/keto reductase-like oxidoreductase
MPKIRVLGNRSAVIKQNKCNYCKNHPNEVNLPVFLKNHGKCKYNNLQHFEDCILCLRNYRKTENTRQWRKDHKNSRNQVQNGK